MSEHDPKEAEGAGAGKTFLPPLDFSSIIAPFYTQALIKLGLIPDPIKGEPDVDLPLARRLIDILDLLSDRTSGRLEPEEATFLESVLSQLKMHFLEKSEAVKL
jgi:hypothetical protein